VEVEARCLANEIFVPNTFSPNGDGRNDRFYPQGLGVAGIKHMRIFNRWGELVFEKTNFSSNDPSQGWDGTYKGKILSPDVFVYMIDVLCSNNQFQELKGNVTLLR
jgi:gliding motility-associated-like protein